jgi:hypothetical protein
MTAAGGVVAGSAVAGLAVIGDAAKVVAGVVAGVAICKNAVAFFPLTTTM